ncbi:MAG: hypothetical protein RIS94_992 [Pseudomonadota bacterium]|jgi:hypothetical protein
MRPREIRLFEWLFVVVLIISAVQSALSWSAARAVLLTQGQGLVGNGALIAVTIISYGGYLALWYFIARNPSRVARGIFVALTLLGILALPVSLRNAQALSPLGMAPMLVSSILQVVCAVLLFRPGTRPWFAQR